MAEPEPGDYDPRERCGRWLPMGRDVKRRRQLNLLGVAEGRRAIESAVERAARLVGEESAVERLGRLHGIRPVCMTPEGIAAAEARVEAEYAELRTSLGLPAVSPHSPEGIRAAWH